MSIIEQIRQEAAKLKRTVILPEGSDVRILQAALEVKALGIAEPVLLGKGNQVDVLAKTSHLDISDIVQHDVDELSRSEFLREHLLTCKKYKDLSNSQISQRLQNPLTLACCMLATGRVDACVAGAVNTTASVIQHGLRIIGTKQQSPLLSSFYLMSFAVPPVEGLEYALFADCAINVNPDSEQLAQIAADTASNAADLFTLDPKVALLSFSTAQSASHPDADKVLNAALVLKQKHPRLDVIGEVQFDAALLPSVRKSKMAKAGYSQPANVYIFPNLDAGNIGYKICERIGGASTVGPILQGLKKPLNDLSRGADVKAIINTVAMSCMQV